MDDSTMKTLLAAAWDAGFDACSGAMISAAAAADRVGYKQALKDVTPIKNPYKDPKS